MPRYFIELSYMGTNYSGWQVQKNAMSVQQKLNEALQIMLASGSGQLATKKVPFTSNLLLPDPAFDGGTSDSVFTTGCGRTDTGVHATQFFAHFDAVNEITDYADFIFKLNGILPFDITIHNLHSVADDAHARYDAVKRTYKYYIYTFKNGFLRQYAGCYYAPLHVELLNAAADIFLHHTDFTSFCKTRAQSKTPYCNLYHAQWKSNNGLFIFEVTADRFLRGMVRAMVGTMVDIGIEKKPLASVEEILHGKNRQKAGAAAPACGLYLTKIEYPYLSIQNNFEFPFVL